MVASSLRGVCPKHLSLFPRNARCYLLESPIYLLCSFADQNATRIQRLKQLRRTLTRLAAAADQRCEGLHTCIRADSRCDNGRIGVVGGSGGASHAAFVAFDISSTSVWPYWNDQNRDDRPVAIACLSGAYDFTDRTADSQYQSCGGDPVIDFRNKIENYTDTCVLFDPNGPNQWSSSPVAHLPQNFTTAMPFRPMYFIHARCDTMPYHQLGAVQCKLSEAQVTSSQYQVLTILDSSEHAFQYWRSLAPPFTVQSPTIGELVISFLNSYLQ